MQPNAHRARRIGLILASLILAVFVVTAGLITFDGLHDRLGKADAGVVLGTKVERDGSPSVALAARLDEALTLYRQGYFARIVVSGGFGKEGHDEATVMRAYLLDHGVPDAAIVVDSHGDNTGATALNSTRWMRAHGLRSLLVVSQYYHLPRTRLAFERCSVKPIYSAHARLFMWRDLYALSREVVGYYGYLLTDRGCAAAA